MEWFNNFKKKVLPGLLVFLAFFISKNVYAEEWLTYDWSVNQGIAYYWEAINWTQTREISDGYITTTLNGDGLGVMRKIAKDGSSIIWETVNDYGYFFGNVLYYEGYIYTMYYDPYYGTLLAKYTSNGKWVDEVQLNNICDYDSNGNYVDSDTDYVWGGELYLSNDKFYVIWKGYVGDSTSSDYSYGPKYYYTVDAKTLKLEESEDYSSVSSSEITSVTKNEQLASENMNSIYQESGYDTHFTTSLNTGNYKYFVGYLKKQSSNDTYSTGLVIKTDMNNNIIWAKKGPDSYMCYDIIDLGDNHVAVATYGASSGWSGNSQILVYDNDGNIVEEHNISEEIGDVVGADIITFSRINNAVIVQVVSNRYSGYGSTYAKSYVVKYTPKYLIETKTDGGGNVEVVGASKAGQPITFKVVPNDGYVLDYVNVTDADGNTVTFTSNTFTMPSADVVIEAKFKKSPFTIITNPETGMSKILYVSLGVITSLSASGLIVLAIRKKKNIIMNNKI